LATAEGKTSLSSLSTSLEKKKKKLDIFSEESARLRVMGIEASASAMTESRKGKALLRDTTVASCKRETVPSDACTESATPRMDALFSRRRQAWW